MIYLHMQPCWQTPLRTLTVSSGWSVKNFLVSVSHFLLTHPSSTHKAVARGTTTYNMATGVRHTGLAISLYLIAAHVAVDLSQMHSSQLLHPLFNSLPSHSSSFSPLLFSGSFLGKWHLTFA